MPNITKSRRIHCIAEEVVSYSVPDDAWIKRLEDHGVSESQYKARMKFPEICHLSPELGLLALEVLNEEFGTEKQIDGEHRLFEELSNLGVFTSEKVESALLKATLPERLDWVETQCALIMMQNEHSRLTSFPAKLREQIKTGKTERLEWFELTSSILEEFKESNIAVRDSYSNEIDEVIEEHEIDYVIE